MCPVPRGLTRVLLILVSVASGHSSAPTVLPLCEVLRDLQAYQGRTVTVRGLVYFGDEVSALGTTSCDVANQTNGYTWPNAIAITGPDEARILGLSAPLALDKSSLEELRTVTAGAGPTAQVWASMTGVLQTRKTFSVWTGGDDRLHANGFGHLGSYPAMLVLGSVGNIRLVVPEGGQRQ